MRMKGHYHEVSPGVWSKYPQTREDALLQKIAFYQPLPVTDPCLRPGHEPGSKIFTKTGIHKCCAFRDAEAAFLEARKNGEPLDPNTAIKKGLDYYWQVEHGKFCGHVGKTTIDGKCYTCAEDRKKISPRQQAIRDGEKWYTPETPCEKCGQVAPKYVDNGYCKGCQEKKKRRSSDTDTKIQNTAPDLIISREDAATNDFNVYRTGKPCKRGHTGWRYVSTGGCLDCLERYRN